MRELSAQVPIRADSPVTITIVLNGHPRTAPTEARMLLSDYLRDVLGATGTRVGCEQGSCGACTVRVDGEAVRSCLTFAVQADGRKVDTVEGLSKDGRLMDLQAAFDKHRVFQCGFCAPGILMTLQQYLELQPSPTEQELRRALAGHLCRCTDYMPIVTAALEVAATRIRLADIDLEMQELEGPEPLEPVTVASSRPSDVTSGDED